MKRWKEDYEPEFFFPYDECEECAGTGILKLEWFPDTRTFLDKLQSEYYFGFKDLLKAMREVRKTGSIVCPLCKGKGWKIWY